MLNLLTIEMNQKINVLQYFEKYNNNIVSQWQIEKLTGLSSFKTRKLIEELIDDLADYPESSISLDKKKVFFIKGISNEVINHLRFSFIQKSLHFQLYMFYFRGNNNLNLFIKELGVSVASAYNIIKKINDELSPYHLKITNQSLEGDEKTIRLVTFEMLSYYFKGIAFVYSDEAIDRFKNQLYPFIKYLNINLSPSSNFQRRLFTEQFFYRNINGSFVGKPTLNIKYIQDKSPHLQRLYAMMKPVFKSTFSSMTDTDFNNEFYYIIEFLISENLLYNKKILEKEVFPKRIIKNTTLLLDCISTSLKTDETDDNIITNLFFELTPVFFKHFHFSNQSQFCAVTEQLELFKNLYPEAALIVQNFFNRQRINSHLPVNIQLFYDCMLRIINFIPHRALAAPIYICVDLSKGTVYSEHVKRHIKSFQPLHIIFEEIISDNTMLYISDFSTYEFDGQQIIWKDLPTANDWNLLENTLIQIKKQNL